MGHYRCKWCGQVVERDSNKQWIKSYCDKTGKDVRLMRVATSLELSSDNELKWPKVEIAQSLSLRDLEKLLHDIFWKRARMEYGEVSGEVNVFEDNEKGTISFEIVGRPSIYTGTGGFLKYLEFGGVVTKLVLNGTEVPGDRIEEFINSVKRLHNVVQSK